MFPIFKKILSVAKKAIFVLSIYFVVISLFGYFISKDKAPLKPNTNIIGQQRKEIYETINDKKLNSTKEGRMSIAMYRTSMCIMIGEGCTNKPSDADAYYKKSLIGSMSSLITIPYTNPPASGIAWVKDGLQSAGFIPKTYASEGIGFASIKPFANLWKIFRDVAYMLLVLVLITIGFMVMFRMKMNPQTVISVENALPKIVVSLILITFSFAIAGFLIDLMYVVIILLVSLLSNNGNYFNVTEFQNAYIGAGVTHLFKDVSAGHDWFVSILPVMGDSIMGLLPPLISTGVRAIVGGIFTVWMTNVMHISVVEPITKALNGIGLATVDLGNLIGAITGPLGSLAMIMILFTLGFTAVFTIILNVLLVGTLLFLVFRIFFLLFSSYLKLLLNIIIAPFLLMFEAIPGRSIFTTWIKNIIGNLIAFPITIAVFLMGYIIVNSSLAEGFSDIRLPYLNGIEPNSFKILVGMGLIILIPDLVKATKDALGIKDLPISIGVGTFFGGAGTIGGALMGGMGQFGSISLALGALKQGGTFGDTAVGKTVSSFLGLNRSKETNPPPDTAKT